MSRAKVLLARLLRPRLLFTLILTVVCALALFYVFANSLEDSPIAYPLFVLSAYTLTVWAVGSVGAAKRMRAAVYAHPLGRRYCTDLPFRGRLSLCGTTAVSVCYGLFELCTALFARSVWFGAIGAYYLLLAAARGVLLCSAYQKGITRRQELYAARLCGWLLLALNLALSALTAQMVLDGKGYAYPGTMIFVMAFYAFYTVISSVVNLVRFRRLRSPVLSASKLLGVATALVSMLSLQTAMFASFGSDYAYQRLMNALVGGILCFALFLMAVFMLIRIRSHLQQEALLQPESRST